MKHDSIRCQAQSNPTIFDLLGQLKRYFSTIAYNKSWEWVYVSHIRHVMYGNKINILCQMKSVYYLLKITPQNDSASLKSKCVTVKLINFVKSFLLNDIRINLTLLIRLLGSLQFWLRGLIWVYILVS